MKSSVHFFVSFTRPYCAAKAKKFFCILNTYHVSTALNLEQNAFIPSSSEEIVFPVEGNTGSPQIRSRQFAEIVVSSIAAAATALRGLWLQAGTRNIYGIKYCSQDPVNSNQKIVKTKF